MKKPNRISSLVILAAILVPQGISARRAQRETARKTEAEIIKDLRSRDHERVNRAIGHIPAGSVRHPETGRIMFSNDFKPSKELIAALVDALDHERRTHYPDGATYTGPAFDHPEGEDELDEALVLALVATGDPAAIPALMYFSIQGVVQEYFLDMGVRAIPALVKLIEDPKSMGFPVAGALVVLANTIITQAKSISKVDMASIQEAAMLHLDPVPAHYATATGYDRGMVFEGAMELASVAGDPELTAILKLIAGSEAEAKRRCDVDMGVEGRRGRPKDMMKYAQWLLKHPYTVPPNVLSRGKY